MGCNACNAVGVGKDTDAAIGDGCKVAWCTFSVGPGRPDRAREALAYVRRRGGMSYVEYQVSGYPVDACEVMHSDGASMGLDGGRKCRCKLRDSANV